MADLLYTQGTGAHKWFKGTPPTTREDGTSLPPTEIDHYNLYVSYNGGPAEVIENDVILSNGTFSASINVDAIASGLYSYTMTTVDTGGVESEHSNMVTMEVRAAPLSPPLPPTLT